MAIGTAFDCFNSKMVRLKELIDPEQGVIVDSFNSKMVRLKASSSASIISISTSFQFQNGTIKRLSPR